VAREEAELREASQREYAGQLQDELSAIRLTREEAELREAEQLSQASKLQLDLSTANLHREQASAEVARLQAALSDVQGTLSTRTEQLQSLESRRQRELQQEAEQTAKAQAAAQSAAARSDWLQEQVSALKAERTTLEGKLESAFNAQREARSQVGSCDRPRHSRRAEAGCTYGEKPSGRVHRQRWAG
jgi:chromosome segregation ATPase